MKRKMTVLAVSLLCLTLLTGCFCQHETWLDATCDTPKTCAECGETEGEALGHVWMAATCEAPKTCETCGLTEGEAKGHSWVEATCTEAKHCENCNLTEGEALGHNWLEATTETPKTCEVCALTEGERIITDPRFTTAETLQLQGQWAMVIPMDGQALGIPELTEPIDFQLVLDFGNDGSMKMFMGVPDEEAFWDAIISVYVDELYAEFAAQGLSREAADQLMKQTYGMGVEEYLKASLENVSINDILSEVYDAVDTMGVYYVLNGSLFTGASWSAPMTEESFTLEGDSLFVQSLADELGVTEPLKRIAE